MKVAIYARVSKERCPTKSCGHLKSEHEKGAGRCLRENCKCIEYSGQDPEVQLDQLRAYATAQQWDAIEFIDYETAKHSDRVQLQAMFTAATRREFNVVLVWALDRLSREGILETLQHLRLLRSNGIQFESFSEPMFRTTPGPYGEIFGELMIALAASFAKMERQRISERTKAGLARAVREGKQLGRQARIFDRDAALTMRRQKPPVSWREIGRRLGVPQSTVRAGLSGVQKTSLQNGKRPKANKPLT